MAAKFTKQNSLREILSQAGREIGLFFSEGMLSFVPEEYRDLPLSQWADKFTMPWGLPFPLDALLEQAELTQQADRLWDWVHLWDEESDTLNTNDSRSVALMVPKCELEGIRPCSIICPGGAYENLAFAEEGYYTALRLQEAGYRTFVLNYRYSPNRWPVPQTDLALSIRHVRANAGRYQIDPSNLMILGYSAGGHLCASTAALSDEVEQALDKALAQQRPDLAKAYQGISIRPDKVCLGYPVISFLEEAHEPSFQNLSGGKEELREHLSVEKQVGPDYPKTYVWACEDDCLVPFSNAVRMGAALERANVPHLLHIYPQGDHGCALAQGTSAEGWVAEMLDFMK